MHVLEYYFLSVHQGTTCMYRHPSFPSSDHTNTSSADTLRAGLSDWSSQPDLRTEFLLGSTLPPALTTAICTSLACAEGCWNQGHCSCYWGSSSALPLFFFFSPPSLSFFVGVFFVLGFVLVFLVFFFLLIGWFGLGFFLFGFVFLSVLFCFLLLRPEGFAEPLRCRGWILQGPGRQCVSS